MQPRPPALQEKTLERSLHQNHDNTIVKNSRVYSNMSYDYVAKVILLGKHNAGKSSLLGKVTDRDRPMATEATIGVDFGAITLRDEKGRNVRLQIWDTAGQDQFQSIVTVYYRQICGAVVVVDVSDRESLTAATEALERLEKHAPKRVPVVLVANKSDIPEEERVIKDAELARFCLENGNLTWFLASAKDGSNVEAPFRSLVKEIGTYFIDADVGCPGLRDYEGDRALRLRSFGGSRSPEPRAQPRCCRPS